MVSTKKVTIVGYERLYDTIARLMKEYSTIRIQLVDNDVFEVKAWNKHGKQILVSL